MLTCITKTRGGRGAPTVGYWFPYQSARKWKLTCITRTRGGRGCQLWDTSSCTVRQEPDGDLYNQDEGWAGGANCRILVPVPVRQELESGS